MATRIGSVELLAELKNELTPALKEIERDAESTGTKAGASMSRIGIGTAAAAAGAVAAGAAFAAFAVSGVRFNAMVESATVKFGAFFGSAQAAEDHVRSLTQFAASTPFQMPGILEASKLLKTFGADAALGGETLRIVGDAAAGVGAPLENVSMWVGRMYTNLKSGKPIGEAASRLQELGLLGGPARNALEALAKEGGKTEEAMALLRGEFDKHEGAMERLSLTTEGLESTAADLTGQLAGEVVELLGLDEAYKQVLSSGNAWMTGVTSWLSDINDFSGSVLDLNAQIREKLRLADETADSRYAATLRDEAAALGEQRDAMESANLEAAKQERGRILTEQLAVGTDALSASRGRLAEIYAEAAKEGEKADAVAAKAAEKAAAAVKKLDDAIDKRLRTSMISLNAAARGAAEGIGTITLQSASLNQVLESRTIPGLDGIGAGAERNARLAKSGFGSILDAAEETATGLPAAWDRGGGMSGLFTGITGAISTFATGGWKSGLASLTNSALSFLPPGMAQAGQAALAAFSAVWSAMKRPSEAEIAARESFAGVHASAVEVFGETAAYQERIGIAIAAGWDSTLAETRIGFDMAAEAAGRSAAEGERLYARYQEAVKSGNTEVVASIEATYQSWIASAAEAEAEVTAAAERTMNAAVSGFQRAESEGERAYQAIYEAAIEAGANEESAIAKAGAARAAAVAKTLADEGFKFARIAAFEAALALGTEATEAQRAAAAAAAAAAALESWDVALTAVTAADEAATVAMQGNAVETANVGSAASARMADAATAEYNRMAGAAATAAGAIQGSIDSIQGKTVDVRVNHHTAYSSSGSSGEPGGGGEGAEARASGGPVEAGQPYIVGEIQPELFVPRTPGHIVPQVPAPAAAPATGSGEKMHLNLYLDGRQVEGLAEILETRRQVARRRVGAR